MPPRRPPLGPLAAASTFSLSLAAYAQPPDAVSEKPELQAEATTQPSTKADTTPASAPPSTTQAAASPLLSRRLHPVLPTFAVSGSTSGKAKARVGFDLIHGVTETIDLSWSPSVEAAINNGSGTLLRIRDGELQDTNLSGSLSIDLISIGDPDDFIKRVDDNPLRSSFRESLDRCIDQCDNNPSARDPKFCAKKDLLEKNNTDPRNAIGISELCESEAERLKKLVQQRKTDFVGGVPKWSLSLGGKGGAQKLKYVDIADPATPTEKAEIEPSGAGALAFFYRAPRPNKGLDVTFDIFSSGGRQTQLPSETVKWCAGIGDVDGSKIDGPGERCTEAAYGAPTPTNFGSLGLMAGMLDVKRQLWRFGIAYVGTYARAAGMSRDTHSIQAPLLLDFTKFAKEGGKIDYKGMLRIIPSFDRVYQETLTYSQFTVTLQLIGQRSMVIRALDWLN